MSTGSTFHDCTLISPTTSPEMLYSVFQLKSFSTHEKNSVSSDIKLSHETIAHVASSHVVCCDIHEIISGLVSIIHETPSAVHGITSAIHEITSLIQLNSSVVVSMGVSEITISSTA